MHAPDLHRQAVPDRPNGTGVEPFQKAGHRRDFHSQDAYAADCLYYVSGHECGVSSQRWFQTYHGTKRRFRWTRFLPSPGATYALSYNERLRGEIVSVSVVAELCPRLSAKQTIRSSVLSCTTGAGLDFLTSPRRHPISSLIRHSTAWSASMRAGSGRCCWVTAHVGNSQGSMSNAEPYDPSPPRFRPTGEREARKSRGSPYQASPKVSGLAATVGSS